jgi:hypothetical protein
VRDRLIDSLDNIFGGNGALKSLEEAIPKIGANLIAAMGVAEQIVGNIKNNFDVLPEAWNEFFTRAYELTVPFGAFLGNLLKDAFSFAVDFFKWSLENANLLKLLWTPFNTLFEKITGSFQKLGADLPFKEIRDFLWNTSREITDAVSKAAPEAAPIRTPDFFNKPVDFTNFPPFKLSDDTKNSFTGLTQALKGTFNAVGDILAGTDVSALFNEKQQEALNSLKNLIDKMGEDKGELKKLLDKGIKDAQNTIKNSLSGANKGFTDAAGHIKNILGNAAGGEADKIRRLMQGLNDRFGETNEKIRGLLDTLKDAGSLERVQELMEQINGEIGNINNLTASMKGLEDAAKKARGSFDTMQRVLQSIGELGAVIEAAMSSNWIGLIITLIGKLADVFGRLSSKAAAARNILDVFFNAIEETMKTMEPALDMIFGPLLDIFTALGRIIGSLLSTVLPVVALITQVTDAFSFLTPILNMVALMVAGIADAVGTVWNRVAGVIEKVSFGLIRLERMNTDNYQRMLDSINVEQDYGQYQNNSTSYSVAGDIYININFSQSYVNGDARGIAIELAREIRAAERAGYV